MEPSWRRGSYSSRALCLLLLFVSLSVSLLFEGRLSFYSLQWSSRWVPGTLPPWFLFLPIRVLPWLCASVCWPYVKSVTLCLAFLLPLSVVMLWAGCTKGRVILTGSEVSVGRSIGTGGVVRSIVLDLRSMVASFCCLGVCHPLAVRVTLRFEIVDIWVVVVAGAYVGGDLNDIVLPNSLVRSCTWICSFVVSCWRRSYSWSICAIR